MNRKKEKNNKRIIVMGASSGLGRDVAEAFAARGWTVGAAARNVDRLVELRQLHPANIVVLPIDIDAHDAAEKLMRLIEMTGGMDIYFHCSGILRDNQALEEKDEIDTVETNVVGFTRMVSAAYRYFRDRGLKGRIAAVSSVAGIRGLGRLASYSASKMYDRGYLQALQQRARIDSTGIRITDIRPGWVRTPLLDSDRHYPLEMSREKVLPKILKAILAGDEHVTIGWRWRVLTSLERLVPARLWSMLTFPLWSAARKPQPKLPRH